MLLVFSSILPVFLLIFIGKFLERLPLFDDQFWSGINRLGFYVLYPVLLFNTIYKADFSGLALGQIILVVGSCWLILGLLTFSIWPLMRQRFTKGQFTSLFQTATRWNGFIALAVAEKMFPPEGAALVALLMAVVVIPINFVNVILLSVFHSESRDVLAIAKKVATNPLIVGAGLAVIVRMVGLTIPAPIGETLHLIGRAALGIGLMAIGAGLIMTDMFRPRLYVWLPVILKLIVLPVLTILMGLAMEIDRQVLSYMVLCAAVPTAMNGYILARQMGGDAPAYAATATVQTALSFLTIPMFLAIVTAISGG